MPNGTNIPTPPMLQGDALSRTSQLHNYLYKLSEQLMMILNSMGTAGGTAQPASSSGDVFAIREDLKRLIVDTTAQLRSEIPMIRSGTAACTAALASGAYEDIAVSFDKMARAPVVNVSLIGDGGAASCQIISGSITESGFTVRVTSGADTQQIYSVAWTAIA